MKEKIIFTRNQSKKDQIAAHLLKCDKGFMPQLSSRVDLIVYAEKLFYFSVRFEAWSNGALIALLAVYCNDVKKKISFISSVSVLPALNGKGIASKLMAECTQYLNKQGFQRVELEVGHDNVAAIKLYRKNGFFKQGVAGLSIGMRLDIRRDEVNNQRNYNREINDTKDHQYAYGFDFDVMHPYMIKSFEPFFNKGSLLELGSFKGDFTKRFVPYFEDITCVEASDVAIEEAKLKLSDEVTFVNSLFEKAMLPKRYDNIVLTHVLEHIDDPILVLKRINDEWLADGGRFFLVCPNANAPSRQIAVKMGLISHNAAVTPAEEEHGHRCTYSLDTLERDAAAAGLKVVHRSGIFFKAMANFQWDKLLQTDIISPEYLEGCYQLGQQYPDLCSSIFLMCEKGEK